MPHFLIHSPTSGHLVHFYVLAVVTSALMNIEVQLSLQNSDFVPSEIHIAVEFLDHMVALFLFL